MPDPTPKTPGTASVATGKVTPCCGLHRPGDWFSCCDDDCLPCCEECPHCPGLVLDQGFNREWAWIGPLGRSVATALALPGA